MLVFAPPSTAPVRVGLWGCGNVGRQIGEGLRAGRGGNADVVGVLARSRSSRLLELADGLGAVPCTSLDELLELRPQVVVEAASPDSLAELGPRIIHAGADLIALSPSCFIRPEVEAAFRAAVEQSGRAVYLPSGSADGLELMLAARCDELRSVRLTITWLPSPRTPAYTGDGGPQEIFSGSVREANQQFKQALNFTVAVALAGLGMDRTELRIQLDPTALCTIYELEADGGPLSLRARIELRPRGRLASFSAVETLARLRAHPIPSGAGWLPGAAV
jgi:aspartate dehydrogenase